ncbi:large Ala/Gln-rich protein [Lysobacter enzymogenes]|uniref:Large Ala/Gln-rich protein n=1 Tax=Lysobacter enzymogenes TaxID=69 RepID=A0A0S2DAL4_LYSEN|nr:peptidoglycan-binding protein [Lysobacter enzymogenes]ALN55555.1 large Ala/Gln-rich protein [Lysobacter enzymogenes]QCW24606.1 hypothetical protein FE772_01845 [Lysobacter enzymogenes]
MASYFLADTSSLIYAYRAGGPQLLDTYRRTVEANGSKLAVSKTVETEIANGPLRIEIGQYLADRDITILTAPEVEQQLASAIDPDEFDKLSKNAGERSLLEIAAREQAEGRNVTIWSDDRHFASPQIQRQLQRDMPGLQTRTTAQLLDQAHRDSFVTHAEYRQHLDGYRNLPDFQDSPRLNSFDPSLASPAAPTTDPAGDEASLRGPKSQGGSASAELLIGESPRHALLRSGGLLATGVDVALGAHRVADRLGQDNPAAARSEAHHVAARNVGGWIGGASAGLVATAAATGPGVVGFIVVGGAAVAGAKVGEHVATVLDSYQTFKQTDRDGVKWESNGRQWVRQDLGDLLDDGQNKPMMQAFSAGPEKANELSYRASNSATELAMGKLEAPRNPYSHAAADSDPASLRRADWERNPQTGAWDRKVVVGFEQPGVPMVRVDAASPERAAELDRVSQQVIQENIANGPAPMAARYQMVHRSEGWDRFGAVPPSIDSALRDDSLIASDGRLYQRTAEGQWQRNGESVIAAGNLRQELDSTRAALQPQLAQHVQQVAAIPAWQPPTLEDIERADLMATYKTHNVNPRPEQLEAALEAVRRTQQEYGVAPLATSLHLGRNASGGYDIDSPIEHIGRDADGANRVHAETSSLDVQMAMLDLRSPPPTAPQAPELRIANLSPQQREALEQVVREANRLGLTRDDVQDSARQAVAGARFQDREPEIVVNAAEAHRERTPRTPEVPSQPKATSPEPTNSAAVAHATAAPLERPEALRRADEASSPVRSSPVASQAAALPAGVSTDTPRPREPSPSPPGAVASEAMPETRREVEPVSAPAPERAAASVEAPPPAQAVRAEVVPAPPVAATPAPEVISPMEPAPRVPDATSLQTAEAPTPAPEVAAPPVAGTTQELEDDRLRPGDRGQDVELLQYRLDRIGYRDGNGERLPQNGQYDAATEQAVRQFQRDQGLADTGIADPSTQQAMSAAQYARIESRKAASQDAPTATPERIAAADQEASLAREDAPTSPLRDDRAVAPAAHAPSSPNARDTPDDARVADAPDRAVPASAVPAARDALPEPAAAASPERPTHDAATMAQPGSAMDLSQLSPNDQAMFAKIRAGAPGHVSDETVAAAMLSAKRDKIQDADSIAQVGVAHGKLWVGATTPGFYGVASLSEPPPAMQETVREAQTLNQQLAREAAQRNPDDPSRGPSR